METKIDWTEMTWNPITGCSKISSGCKNCYASRMARRLQNVKKNIKYRNGFEVTIHPETFTQPFSWRKPKMVFVNSMSDLFHEKIPLEIIQKLFDVMNQNPKHTFQVLTKRSKRVSKLAPLLNWTSNIWMGVSIENQNTTSRIDDLRAVPAQVRFLSCEPLLEPIDFDPTGLHWIIVGCESGPKARRMSESWVKHIKELAVKAHIPFFYKQKDMDGKIVHLPILDGRQWAEYPAGQKQLSLF